MDSKAGVTVGSYYVSSERGALTINVLDKNSILAQREVMFHELPVESIRIARAMP